MGGEFHAATAQARSRKGAGTFIFTITTMHEPFFNFRENAALHHGPTRLLRIVIVNGTRHPAGTVLMLPGTILAALTPGTDYEAVSEPQDGTDHGKD